MGATPRVRRRWGALLALLALVVLAAPLGARGSPLGDTGPPPPPAPMAVMLPSAPPAQWAQAAPPGTDPPLAVRAAAQGEPPSFESTGHPQCVSSPAPGRRHAAHLLVRGPRRIGEARRVCRA